MNTTYFKRFRMEVDLLGRAYTPSRLPEGYRLMRWDPRLTEAHAEAKYHSFRGEIDSNVFPCLGDYGGCLRLMHEIQTKEGFLPAATWLVVRQSESSVPPEPCGTIQGIRDAAGFGAIQNLGVAPEHRGRGLGEYLLLRALEGFQRSHLRRSFLEVTAQNSGAIRLYQRLGFVRVRTVYKSVEVAYS